MYVIWHQLYNKWFIYHNNYVNITVLIIFPVKQPSHSSSYCSLKRRIIYKYYSCNYVLVVVGFAFLNGLSARWKFYEEIGGFLVWLRTRKSAHIIFECFWLRLRYKVGGCLFMLLLLCVLCRSATNRWERQILNS